MPVKPVCGAGGFEDGVVEGLRYRVRLPVEGEDDWLGRAPWPVILFLHGAGERGEDLGRVTKHGPWRHAAADRFFIVAPQCPSRRTWPEVGVLSKLLDLLDRVVDSYPVDPCRVYLSGISMGGSGCWALACTVPERFAAIIPVCGGFITPVPGRLALPALLRHATRSVSTADVFNIGNFPALIFHGTSDCMVPMAASKNIFIALGAHANPLVDLVIFEQNGEHDWSLVYDCEATYEWMLRHRKPRACPVNIAPVHG